MDKKIHTDEEVERISRILCKINNVDPDEEYWEAHWGKFVWKGPLAPPGPPRMRRWNTYMYEASNYLKLLKLLKEDGKI